MASNPSPLRLDAPFPWFGGKRKVAADVWKRFGTVTNYLEPFFGSGAVLLGRPAGWTGVESINDLDGYVTNFWRSVKYSAAGTAEWATNPIHENELHARHVWLLQHKDTLRGQLEGNPDWHDPKIAGWWVWGISNWIGSGFCSGKGAWSVNDVGQLVPLQSTTQGLSRQRPPIDRSGSGVTRPGKDIVAWFAALSERLRTVRIYSGDWSRICNAKLAVRAGVTGVFLDPPYADTANRVEDLYRMDSLSVAHAVRLWAVENGDNPNLRIALCGYAGEHQMPETWTEQSWSATGGYGRTTHAVENTEKERIWFSPHCVSPSVSTSASSNSLF